MTTDLPQMGSLHIGSVSDEELIERIVALKSTILEMCPNSPTDIMECFKILLKTSLSQDYCVMSAIHMKFNMLERKGLGFDNPEAPWFQALFYKLGLRYGQGPDNKSLVFARGESNYAESKTKPVAVAPVAAMVPRTSLPVSYSPPPNLHSISNTVQPPKEVTSSIVKENMASSYFSAAPPTSVGPPKPLMSINVGQQRSLFNEPLGSFGAVRNTSKTVGEGEYPLHVAKNQGDFGPIGQRIDKSQSTQHERISPQNDGKPVQNGVQSDSQDNLEPARARLRDMKEQAIVREKDCREAIHHLDLMIKKLTDVKEMQPAEEELQRVRKLYEMDFCICEGRIEVIEMAMNSVHVKELEEKLGPMVQAPSLNTKIYENAVRDLSVSKFSTIIDNVMSELFPAIESRCGPENLPSMDRVQAVVLKRIQEHKFFNPTSQQYIITNVLYDLGLASAPSSGSQSRPTSNGSATPQRNLMRNGMGSPGPRLKLMTKTPVATTKSQNSPRSNENKNPWGIAGAKKDRIVTNEPCQMCLEEVLPDKTSVNYCPHCKQPYHEECILPWLEASPKCPNCQRQWSNPHSFPSLSETRSNKCPS